MRRVYSTVYTPVEKIDHDRSNIFRLNYWISRGRKRCLNLNPRIHRYRSDKQSVGTLNGNQGKRVSFWTWYIHRVRWPTKSFVCKPTSYDSWLYVFV